MRDLKRMFVVATVLIPCSVVLGCMGEEDGFSTSANMDGVPTEIAADPRLTLGVTTGDTLQEFHRVATPFLLTDNRVVVPLRAAEVLRIFGEDGEFITSLGGAGDGPGEFSRLRSAWARGDTVEAVDSRRRITRFLPDGGVEVVTLEGDASVETVVPGAWAEGWVTMGIAQVAYGFRDEIVLHGFSMEGAHLGELGRLKGMKRISGSGVAGVHPLSPRPVYRVGGGKLFMAETERAQIQVVRADGTVATEVEWEIWNPHDPSEGMEIVRTSPDLTPFYQALIVDADVPDRLSVFWDFLVDELGFIWIREYDPVHHAAALDGMAREGGDGFWRVLAPDGVEVGVVEVPQGLRPVQIRKDDVVGIWVDSLGVEFIHVHDLTRN